MKLRRVYNKHIPLKGFVAFTLFPWVFIREDLRQKYTPTVNRHENIHAVQQIEVFVFGVMLAVFMLYSGCEWWSLLPLPLFFWLYILEWIIKLPFCNWNLDKTYHSISFEQEAYYHQGKIEYILLRDDYAWVKYIFKFYKKK